MIAMKKPTLKAAKIRNSSATTISKYRQLAGLSQTELARQLNVSQPLVSSWECGRVTPSIYDIAVLERVLKTECGEMFFQIAYPKMADNPNEEVTERF